MSVSTIVFDPVADGVAVAAPLPDVLPPVKRRRGLIGFCVRHPSIAIGGVILLAIVLIAVLAPYLATVDPTALATSRRTRAPSAAAWFGTDMLGRDVYSRVLFGARVSLMVGFSVAILASIAGLVIGIVSGFVRWADGIIMRVMDGLMSIPPILLAIALMALTRGSVQNVIIAITIAEIPRVSRLVRSVVLSLREQPYVDAAVAAGTPPTIPSWGNIMAEGRSIWQVKPYIVFFPAVFLSVTVLSVNLMGDGLRDALDPRMAKNI